MILQTTHRVAGLPGLKDKLLEIGNCDVITLEPGAGALGVLRLRDQLTDAHFKNGTSFFTSRPWQITESAISPAVLDQTARAIRPSHLLYRDVAYPVTEKSLIIGCDHYPFGKGIHVQATSTDVSKKHCTVHREGDRIVLTDHSSQGTFVDHRPVHGSAILELGQIVRFGTSRETMKLIACLKTDET